MKVSKQTYRTMNKAYNMIFDSWQEIEEMPPQMFQQLNTSLVLLDGVLDFLKENATEDAPASDPQPSKATKITDDDAPKFEVFGGK